MSIKSEVLYELERNNGYISGEQLASRLGVSRVAVNKAIKSLVNDGYTINAVTNKGYCMVKNDILSAEGVRGYLPDMYKDIKINFYKQIDSTNNEAKRAIYTETKPAVFLADSQTNGRGRLGRSFYSPQGESIYLSILLKPNFQNGVKITSYVAVAVAMAIEELTDKKVDIKWVNDLFINGKKVVGILCEGVTGLENNELEAVVIGVGLNCRLSNIPKDIENIVGNILADTDVSRNKLTAKVITNIMDILSKTDDSVMQIYRQKSMVLGKEIKYFVDNEWHYGKVQNIDDNGALLVSSDDGTRLINSGEVTIRNV